MLGRRASQSFLFTEFNFISQNCIENGVSRRGIVQKLYIILLVHLSFVHFNNI